MSDCKHPRVRRMTGCAATDLETGECMFACLACGFQGTIAEINAGKPYGVTAVEVVDRDELRRRYSSP